MVSIFTMVMPYGRGKHENFMIFQKLRKSQRTYFYGNNNPYISK
jgi:hypothetical protein